MVVRWNTRGISKISGSDRANVLFLFPIRNVTFKADLDLVGNCHVSNNIRCQRITTPAITPLVRKPGKTGNLASPEIPVVWKPLKFRNPVRPETLLVWKPK